jgi:2-desacetyl-2-hydroxyethyl bacteriochlorophyllide A dehydrogenase
MTARTVYFTGPREVAVRDEPVPDPGAGEVRVSTTVSAISSGTELLVYRDEVRTDLAVDATLETLSGSFEYPVSYGYAAVGTVTQVGDGVDRKWVGETVLAFHPHAEEFVVPVEDVSPVPEGVSPRSAVFLPNVETAVNLLLDGGPLIGEQAVVLGQGVVGLLTTALLAQSPLDALLTLDLYERRRELSEAYGADESLDPAVVDPVEAVRERTDRGRRTRPGPAGTEPSPQGADLTYELSGNPGALDLAVGVTGYAGRVVVGSWYGTKTAELSLDGRFHRSRISLVSSQVSTIAPERRGRWTKRRRLETAWRRLESLELDGLITHEVPLEDAPDAYELLDERPREAVQVVLTC